MERDICLDFGTSPLSLLGLLFSRGTAWRPRKAVADEAVGLASEEQN